METACMYYVIRRTWHGHLVMSHSNSGHDRLYADVILYTASDPFRAYQYPGLEGY